MPIYKFSSSGHLISGSSSLPFDVGSLLQYSTQVMCTSELFSSTVKGTWSNKVRKIYGTVPFGLIFRLLRGPKPSSGGAMVVA